MLYHIIKFKDGEEKKLPIEYGTESYIREQCIKLGLEVSSIRQANIDVEPKKENNSNLLYEVRLSFNEDAHNITITKDELAVVMWAFLKDAKAICRNGAFRGKDIISILPNFNSMLGFNKGYELTPEDFALISRDIRCINARNYQNHVKSLCYESKTSQDLLDKVGQILLA